MNTKHTPGPWKWAGVTSCDTTGPDKGRGYYCIAPEGDPQKVFCDVRGLTANARLIAAAPDLMEACELFAELDNCNDQRDRLAAFDAKHGVKAGQGRYSLLFERARAAIAKATGGAS